MPINYQPAPRTLDGGFIEWFVYGAEEVNDGITYITQFHGHDSEERAREYAAWKNGEATSPTHKPPFRMEG